MAIRIKEEHIKALYHRVDIKEKIMSDFGIINIQSIRRWIRSNRPNGPLTSKACLKILARGLDVPEKDLTEQTDEVIRKRGECNAAPVQG